MTRNTTKRALVMSMISLILCVSMLAGSTFAWFTDTASTGVNKIVSGNLDVELNYYDEVSDKYVTAENNNGIFSGDLWEPGFTKVVYFQVKNAGSLAFVYQIGTNLIENVKGETEDGKEIDLTNYIKFAIVNATAGEFGDDRDAARAAVTASQSFGELSSAMKLASGASAEFALVAFMPEDIGNEANYKTSDDLANPTKYAPYIDFGVTVKAAQDTVESDSFDNKYDENVGGPVNVSTADALNEALSNPDVKNILVSGGTYSDEVEVPEGKNLTVNNAEIDTSANYGIAFSVGKDSNLVLNGGSFTAFGYAQVIDAQKAGSEVTVNGGTYEGNYLLCIDNDVKATVNGGTFTTPEYPGTVIAMTTSDNNSTSVAITGGTFYSEAICDNYIDIVITGGTFYLNGITHYPNLITKDVITIKGGTFNVDPTDYVDTTAYDVTEADGMFTVTAK